MPSKVQDAASVGGDGDAPATALKTRPSSLKRPFEDDQNQTGDRKKRCDALGADDVPGLSAENTSSTSDDKVDFEIHDDECSEANDGSSSEAGYDTETTNITTGDLAPSINFKDERERMKTTTLSFYNANLLAPGTSPRVPLASKENIPPQSRFNPQRLSGLGLDLSRLTEMGKPCIRDVTLREGELAAHTQWPNLWYHLEEVQNKSTILHPFLKGLGVVGWKRLFKERKTEAIESASGLAGAPVEMIDVVRICNMGLFAGQWMVQYESPTFKLNVDEVESLGLTDELAEFCSAKDFAPLCAEE